MDCLCTIHLGVWHLNIILADILETLWFSGFILAKGCVDIAGIALRYPKTKMALVYKMVQIVTLFLLVRWLKLRLFF